MAAMILPAVLIAWVGLVPAIVVGLRLRTPSTRSLSAAGATAGRCQAPGRRRLRPDRATPAIGTIGSPLPLDRNRH